MMVHDWNSSNWGGGGRWKKFKVILSCLKACLCQMGPCLWCLKFLSYPVLKELPQHVSKPQR